MNTKQVLVIRKDLNMRKGKIAAQAAHASLAVLLNEGHIKFDDGYTEETGVFESSYVIPMDKNIKDWLTGIFTKICVSVDSEEELLSIHQQAKDAGLICSLIQDAGLTEFGGVPTYTAVAVGPAESEDIDKITGGLKLL